MLNEKGEFCHGNAFQSFGAAQINDLSPSVT